MTGNEQDWFDANRRMWDERVPIHVEGDFYDVAAFRAGQSTLRDFELEHLGDVTGRDLVHLQCHFGMDTLSWARRGAQVTGLDFSPPAIETARRLAGEIGVEARFEVGNVYDAPAILGADYDVVYTGLGALNWLPDLARWADVVVALLRPGGMLFLPEFHPVHEVFADEDFTVKYPYFGGAAPLEWNDPGTYADPQAATTHNRSYAWTHPVSRVIQTLLDRGLVLERFDEFDYTLYQRWPFMEKSGRDIYRLPASMPSVPLMYALRMTKA